MLTGYNTDFKFQGKVYHCQTEDGGANSPFITSLLYFQGAILASRKTSYADILKADCLDEVVRELMMEQHKQMIRDLMQGKLNPATPRMKQRISQRQHRSLHPRKHSRPQRLPPRARKKRRHLHRPHLLLPRKSRRKRALTTSFSIFLHRTRTGQCIGEFSRGVGLVTIGVWSATVPERVNVRTYFAVL